MTLPEDSSQLLVAGSRNTSSDFSGNRQPATGNLLRRFTKVVAFSTLLLIFAGAMVTSTGSGLAVPDWPLNYGMLLPPMVGGILYETGHRYIASFVGFLVVIQAIWLQMREPKRFVRMLGWTSLGAVITQGILGGMTVLFLQPHALSVAHGAVAEIFLCINVSIAFFTSRSFLALRDRRPIDDAPIASTTALVVLVYLQIIAGALMRHLGAGLAIPDFPLSFGRIIPAFTSPAIAANFAHRAGALLVTIAMIVVIARILPRGADVPSALRRIVLALIAVVALQIFLGAEVVWTGDPRLYHSLAGNVAMKHAAITSLHVVTGALTLALSLLLALTTRTVARRTAPAEAGAFVATEVAA
jgi:cytochrome c oxidase assembly protein subunit 15